MIKNQNWKYSSLTLKKHRGNSPLRQDTTGVEVESGGLARQCQIYLPVLLQYMLATGQQDPSSKWCATAGTTNKARG